MQVRVGRSTRLDRIVKLVVLVFITLLLFACGGGDGDTQPPTNEQPPTDTIQPGNGGSSGSGETGGGNTGGDTGGFVAPPISVTKPTGLLDAASFLFSGDVPIQTGVTPGAITETRIVVLRGKVTDDAGQPISGVVISVLDQPQYGQTESRAGGIFDLAVNGGGSLTLLYRKNGYIPVQRSVDTPWQDYIWTPDVVMVAYDSKVNAVAVNSAAMQVARGSVSSDDDGTRQATILIPPATSAKMVLPNGTETALTEMSMRLTEFTVGENGRKKMPAELPPASSYTYAAEFSIDQAVAAGAREVKFSKALPVYVENFLNFPVGTSVPLGYYDRDRAQWVAAESGVVVKVVSISNGSASLDLDGDGNADNGDNIGVTAAELQHIASLYQAGQTLWRVQVDHFSAWDMNWGFGPPDDALPPHLRVNNPNVPTNKRCGSIIGCENQNLGEAIPITGTPFNLHYNSDQVAKAPNVLDIPLVGDTFPPSLKRVDLEIDVAGQFTKRHFSPQANLTYHFVYDGKDGYGREVFGQQQAKIKISYVYNGVYQATQRFGYNGNGVAISGDRARSEISFPLRYTENVGVLRQTALRLPGWSLSPQHAYSQQSRELLLGTGERSIASRATISTILGDGVDESSGDGGDAKKARTRQIDAIAASADGSIYFIESLSRIRRIAPDGKVSNYAGKAWGPNPVPGDGGPAINALMTPVDFTIAPDGDMYIADHGFSRVRKIDRNGIITTVAGAGLIKDQYGVTQSAGDGGPAINASIKIIQSVAVARDGTIYFSEENRIRRIGSDGIVTTLLGDGSPGYTCGEGDGRVTAWKLLAHSDGSLYYLVSASYYGYAVCKRAQNGDISIVAGYTANSIPEISHGPVTGGDARAAQFPWISDIALSADGSLFIADLDRHRIMRLDEQNRLVLVAGWEDLANPYYKKRGYAGDGQSAIDALFSEPNAIGLSPDGRLFIGDQGNRRLRQVEANTLLIGSATDDVDIANAEGSEVFTFDINGRHKQTREPLTGAALYTFNYDENGALNEIVDGSNNRTSIEWSSGLPTAIVAPGGQRTTLTTDGVSKLMSVSNPAGETVSMQYTTDGLLGRFAFPAGGASTFEYDGDGRLTKDTDADGRSVTLARTVNIDGYTVTATTGKNRVYTYQIKRAGNGAVEQVATDAAGASSIRRIYPTGDQEITYPSGGTASVKFAPDPRWGQSAAYPSRIALTTPGGRAREITMARIVTLTNAIDPWSLSTFEEKKTELGLSRTLKYSSADRSVRITSRSGRTFEVTLDAFGRAASYWPDPAIDPIERTFNDQGLIASVMQGNVSRQFAYDAKNRLFSVTNGDGKQTQYEYDMADRMTKVTVPSGRAYRFAYDANGNLTSVTMPNGKQQRLSYSPANRETNYRPADSANGIDWSYDLDGAWTTSTLLSGATLSASYDAGGRPSGRSYSGVTVEYSYNNENKTSRVNNIKRTPAVAANAQNISLTYDAELITAMSWTGVAAGTFNYAYDDRTLLSGISGTINIAYTRDNDGLITQQGPFTFTRGGPMSAVSAITDNKLALSFAYDTNGRFAQRSMSVNGVALYNVQLSYNAANRITQRVETINGTAKTQDVTYDNDGQLATLVSGSVMESYEYDVNGNRTTFSAGYDAQDRLSALNGISYTFNTDGYLQTRGADTFTYNARGELVSATVGATTVNYQYDGLGRRISRAVGSAVTHYYYANPYNPLQLTAARSPANVLSVYHYDQNGLLFAIVQGSTYYYVASDERGTPKLVANASGVAQKVITHNSYGVVTSDSAPEFFLPIGFAGGLVDDVTGLVRMGYRDYDPAAGRWAARDPALFDGKQMNLYTYAGNDPINSVDRSGLFGVGFSAYEGIGGGFRLIIDKTGFKICGEIGVGLGTSLEVDPFEEVGDVDLTPKLIGEVGLGPFGAGLELSQIGGDCFTLDKSLKAGPFKGKFEGPDAEFSGMDFTNFELKMSAEAKLAVAECGGMKF